MSSKKYIEDCVRKSGPGKCLLLTEKQTGTIQGLLAGSIESGRVLTMLKKDVFEYGRMRINGPESYPEEIKPLLLSSNTYTALRAVLGVNGEVADISETIYSHIKDGTALEIDKLKEDLGDLSFYISLILSLIGSDWEEIQTLNTAKTDTIAEANRPL